MPLTHAFLALLVAVIWGVNFVFIKLGLQDMSPLLLCALRFFLASVPFVFFIKIPAVPFRMVITYGLVMFDMQFSLLFVSLQVGMTSGMASLIMQAQIFFSMVFAAYFLNERFHRGQILGALVAFLGIALVGLHLDQTISWLGFVCVLGSAASWGYGNLITKRMSRVNMISLVVWGSFIACWPMLLLSVIFEGKASMMHSITHISLIGLTSLLYIVYASTWVGYGLWNWLISRYPVGKVVPFTLLVPVVGMFSSALILGEPLQSWKLVCALLIISGLCINLFGQPIFRYSFTKRSQINKLDA